MPNHTLCKLSYQDSTKYNIGPQKLIYKYTKWWNEKKNLSFLSPLSPLTPANCSNSAGWYFSNIFKVNLKTLLKKRVMSADAKLCTRTKKIQPIRARVLCIFFHDSIRLILLKLHAYRFTATFSLSSQSLSLFPSHLFQHLTTNIPCANWPENKQNNT